MLFEYALSIMLKYIFISPNTELKLNFILRENIQSLVYNNYKYLWGRGRGVFFKLADQWMIFCSLNAFYMQK